MIDSILDNFYNHIIINKNKNKLSNLNIYFSEYFIFIIDCYFLIKIFYYYI